MLGILKLEHQSNSFSNEIALKISSLQSEDVAESGELQNYIIAKLYFDYLLSSGIMIIDQVNSCS